MAKVKYVASKYKTFRGWGVMEFIDETYESITFFETRDKARAYAKKMNQMPIDSKQEIS